MSGKVKVEVVEGPMKGESFLFEEHDTFMVGRHQECHAHLPKDQTVSRHHCILEANPPNASIRDLGSLFGTYVNGVKHGGRETGETPETGAKRLYPDVALKHGDRIKVGSKTELLVQIEVAAICCECGCSIDDKVRDNCAWIGGTFICPKCKANLISMNKPAKPPEPVRCQKCGKDVSSEIGKGVRGSYICEVCRNKADADPMQILKDLLQIAGKHSGGGQGPDIEGYTIEKPLGIGGFGAVYLARRKKDGERVAIKVMLAKVAVDETNRKRFMREVDLTKDLRHPHIVPFIENGAVGGAFYFVMEYCSGGSIAGLMANRGGKLALSEAGPIMLQALEGLAYAHSKNVIHRDLKPQNILLGSSDAPWNVKVSDLGLGKNFDKYGLSGITVTGSTAGTPYFMPRDQVVNFKRMTFAGDVWSMAATFYNMLTGQYPRDFRRGKDPMDIILNGQIIPIRTRDSGIPRGVAKVVDRALSNDAKARPQNAEAMRKALEKVL